jgi:hypothetical protein
MAHEDIVRRECRRLFLIAASKHEEILLIDSLHEKVFSKLPGTPAELERLLRDWSGPHRLDYTWVLDAARNLYYFSRTPNSDKVLYATFETSWPAYEAGPFSPSPWAPNEDLDKYRQRVILKFEQYIDELIVQIKESRRPLQHRGSQSDHYRWAAECVCLKLGWTEIADRHARKHQQFVTPQAVRDAVLKVLEKIGIRES